MLALLRNKHCAGVSYPADPADLETANCERGAQGAGEMRAALAPIETRPTEYPPRSTGFAQLNAEAAQELFPRRSHDAAILGERNMFPLDKRVG